MPGYYYYGFDATYILFVIPALMIAVFAQIKVKSAYSKYSAINNRRGISGAEAAERVLRTHGVYDVRIERVAGQLTDHYDPRNNCIRLSDGVYSGTSIAAVGVAAHEAGHAVQYAQSYLPIRIRSIVIPITNFGSMLALPLFLLGLVFSFSPLMYLGILFYSLSFLFQIITLPVEFNASSRALKTIKDTGLLSEGSEYTGAKRMLTAAALTYVAAMLTSLAQLLRLLALANRRK